MTSYAPNQITTHREPHISLPGRFTEIKTPDIKEFDNELSEIRKELDAPATNDPKLSGLFYMGSP